MCRALPSVVSVFLSPGHLQLQEFIGTVLLFATMDFSNHPAQLMSFTSALLLLLLNANRALDFLAPTEEVDDPGCILTGIDNQPLEPLFDIDAVAPLLFTTSDYVMCLLCLMMISDFGLNHGQPHGSLVFCWSNMMMAVGFRCFG
jgi:hypothetical protein